jgi:DDE superfamily endonuclease
VIDGTLIPVDRVAKDRPFYSGKHKKHGMNLQVISSPDGDILWVSGPLPGSVHDLTAARIWGIIRQLAAAGLITLADKGYIGAGQHVLVPYRAGASRPRRKRPTPPTPGCGLPASAPTPSSRPGTSCASSAAAPGAPGKSPKPSTSFKPARSEDEKGSVSGGTMADDEPS